MDQPEKKPSVDADFILEHQYDGIQEYDNPMPSWWVWMYWGSFWFSLAYLFHYWVGNGQSVAASYDEDVAVAAAERSKEALKQQVSEQSLTQLLQDPSSVEKGAASFLTKCTPCHMEQGQGSIGPNLTDNHWIHGSGTLMDIHGIVSEGVPAKGMPAWNRQLTPEELRQIVAFVGSIRGKNVPGKPPEGNPTQ